MTREAFDVNRKAAGINKGAMLPMLGMQSAAVRSGLAEQFPIGDVDGYLAALHASIGDAANVVKSNIIEASKALGADVPQAFSYSTMSFMPDPTNYGLTQWPGLSAEALRKISRENIAPQMVIRSRVTDLVRYSGLSSHIWMPGWRIVMMDPKETPTAQDKKDIKDAERFIWNCSREAKYTDARERDASFIAPFEMFLRSFADDTLTFDGHALWTDMDSKGGVRAFCNLPAGMIRLAIPTRGYKGNPAWYACMVDETGNPIKPFTRNEMTWRVRNVRLDPSVMGYGYPEIEMCVRLIQGFQAGLDLNIDTFCYSSDTEVLTKDGWRTFDQVEIDREEFATLNTLTGAFEYQKASEKVWTDYDGDMYAVESRSIDLVVTPNHRLITQYRPNWLSKRDARYKEYTAEAMYAKMQGMTPLSRANYCLPMASVWEGVEIQEKKFGCSPSQYIENKERSISGDDYCAWMGMYLAEGNISAHSHSGKPHVIVITQKPSSKGYEPFKDLMVRVLGKEPYYGGSGQFSIHWWGFAEHIRQFGTGCYDKIIPAEILNATPRQQQIFWSYLLAGDGYKRPATGQQHIATTSKIMADQLQELAQKMGFAATVCKVDAQKYESVLDGRTIRATGPRYDVYLKRSIMQSFDMVKGSYHGKIGCVTVPNGTLYVRRGGKAAWCGNTKSAIPNGMLLLKGDYFNQDQIDALMREWTNMKRGISKLWGMPVMAIPEGGDVELLQFMDLKGTDVRYKDHLNMMAGLCCIIYNFPIRRLGMFASGNHRDNQPVQDAAVEIQGADDPGLPALLEHLEGAINPYLLWTNWPRLRFEFVNKNPKSDARSYDFRKQAQTWGEARAEADLPELSTVYSADLKPLADIMSGCPEDPAKSGVYQTVAVAMLQAQLGVGGEESGKIATPGARMTPSKDPAISLAHGHASGVRRDSKAEAASSSKKEG